MRRVDSSLVVCMHGSESDREVQGLFTSVSQRTAGWQKVAAGQAIRSWIQCLPAVLNRKDQMDMVIFGIGLGQKPLPYPWIWEI
jgi:hypothetical protein